MSSFANGFMDALRNVANGVDRVATSSVPVLAYATIHSWHRSPYVLCVDAHATSTVGYRMCSWCRGPGPHPPCLMARAALICPAPSCSSLMPCPTHPSGPWANSTRRTQLPRNWARIRKRVLKRDPLCTLGYEGCTGFSTEVHHTGDPSIHTDDVLAGTCSSCHSRDTAVQSRQAKADQALGLGAQRERSAMDSTD